MPSVSTRLSELSAATIAIRGGHHRALRELTPGERTEVSAMRLELKAWLLAPATVEDIRELVMPVLATMACRDPGLSVANQAAGYLIGLAGVSRSALAEAMIAVLQGRAGLTDLHFAPSPPELRRLAEPKDELARRQIQRCDLLLALKPKPAAPLATQTPPVATRTPPATTPAPIVAGYAQRVAADLAQRKAKREAPADAVP